MNPAYSDIILIIISCPWLMIPLSLLAEKDSTLDGMIMDMKQKLKQQSSNRYFRIPIFKKGIKWDPYATDIYTTESPSVNHVVQFNISDIIKTADWAAESRGTAGAQSTYCFSDTIVLCKGPIPKKLKHLLWKKFATQNELTRKFGINNIKWIVMNCHNVKDIAPITFIYKSEIMQKKWDLARIKTTGSLAQQLFKQCNSHAKIQKIKEQITLGTRKKLSDKDWKKERNKIAHNFG